MMRFLFIALSCFLFFSCDVLYGPLKKRDNLYDYSLNQDPLFKDFQTILTPKTSLSFTWKKRDPSVVLAPREELVIIRENKTKIGNYKTTTLPFSTISYNSSKNTYTYDINKLPGIAADEYLYTLKRKNNSIIGSYLLTNVQYPDMKVFTMTQPTKNKIEFNWSVTPGALKPFLIEVFVYRLTSPGGSVDSQVLTLALTSSTLTQRFNAPLAGSSYRFTPVLYYKTLGNPSVKKVQNNLNIDRTF